MNKRTLDKITKLITAFTAKRSKTTGGWAPVVDEDVGNLMEIIIAVMDAKYDRDPGADLPIQVTLIDRNVFEGQPLCMVPYRIYPQGDATDDEVKERHEERLRAYGDIIQEYMRYFLNDIKFPYLFKETSHD